MTLLRSIGCVAYVVALCGGCARFGSSEPPPAPVDASEAVDTVVVVDTVDAGAAVVEDLQARIGHLEIMLLERDARLAELQQTLAGCDAPGGRSQPRQAPEPGQSGGGGLGPSPRRKSPSSGSAGCREGHG